MSKEDDFKQRLIAVMQDLQGETGKDPEVLYVVGAIGAQLVAESKKPNWKVFKKTLAPINFRRLLNDFQRRGNALHHQGKTKHVKAVTILATSLIAGTQSDPLVKSGNDLLDDLIGQMINSYKRAVERQKRA